MSESHLASQARSICGTITFIMISGEPWKDAQEGVVRFDWRERSKGSLTVQTLRIMIPGMQVVIPSEDLEDEGGR